MNLSLKKSSLYFYVIALIFVFYNILTFFYDHTFKVSILYSFSVLILILSFLFYKKIVNNNLHTLSFFIVYIIISYLLRIVQVESNQEYWTITGGYQRIGSFDFSNEMFLEYFGVVIYGTIGLFCGCITAYFFYKVLLKNKKKIQNNDTNSTKLSRKLNIYFSLYFLIIFIAYFFNIGVSGKIPVELPFKLSGLILFLKNFIFPMIGWHLFYYVVKYTGKSKTTKFLFIQTIIGLLSTYLTLSKAMLIYSLAPYFLYLIISKKYLIYNLIIKNEFKSHR